MASIFNPCLYLVIGPENCPNTSMIDVVSQSISGGVTLIQYRNKHASQDAQVADVKKLLSITKPSGIPLLVNDNVDVAVEAGADGVHIGQSDMAVEEARQRLGKDAIIGLTVKFKDHIDAAPFEFLDYLGIGGVFPTSSKVNPDAPIGLEGLSAMVAATKSRDPKMLTTAIAGLDETNCESVARSGVDGLAVVSAICGKDDPKLAASNLRRLIENAMLEGCNE